MNPSVSIIVPVYNGEATIGRCVRSLLAQTVPVSEIWVVDDGSTDRTRAVVQEVGPAVKILETGGRKGAGAARNAAARIATGDVLCFTDADVEAPSDWVAKILRDREARTVRCGGGGYAGPLQEIFIEQFAHEELVWRRRHRDGFVDTLVSNNLWCDRAVFLEVGGFPETYRAASLEDMEFSWAVSRKYRLWWAADNGVYHDFPATVKKYLSQQTRFAKDSVVMIRGNRSLANGGQTHHGWELYIEVGLTGLGVLVPPCWLGVLLLNAGFLLDLARQRGGAFAGKAVGMVFLRNFAAIYGAVLGLLEQTSRPQLPAEAGGDTK